MWDAPAGGMGILVRQGIPARQILPPKGAPRNEADTLALVALHPLVPRLGGPGARGGFPACPGGVRRLGPAGPQLDFLGPRHTVHGPSRDGPATGGGGDLNFDLDYPLRAPPSVLASLLTTGGGATPRVLGRQLPLPPPPPP